MRSQMFRFYPEGSDEGINVWSTDEGVQWHADGSVTLEDGRIARCASADRRKLTKLLTGLRRSSPAKEEWAAHKVYRQVAFMEEKAGKSKTKRMQAAQGYAMIAKKYPDTAAGRKAAEAAKRLSAALSGGR